MRDPKLSLFSNEKFGKFYRKIKLWGHGLYIFLHTIVAWDHFSDGYTPCTTRVSVIYVKAIRFVCLADIVYIILAKFYQSKKDIRYRRKKSEPPSDDRHAVQYTRNL